MTDPPLALIERAYADGWALDPALTVSEWADRHLILDPAVSPEAGQWRTSRTPYLRAIMDALSSHDPTERVVVMSGTQIGKTSCGNAWLGYMIHHSPGPMLFVEPTTEIAKAESKQRVATMIDSSPALRGLVSAPRSRDSGNTILMKEFRGGVLAMVGANSAAGLRRMPARYLFLDEVDAYPGDVEGEGDPIALAVARAANFPRRKILITSTPTTRGVSRIELEYLGKGDYPGSDQRRYFIPCPACGHMDYLTWNGKLWNASAADTATHHRIAFDGHDPMTARMVCSGCGADVPEHRKTWMLERGEWRPTAEGSPGVAGFHLSAMYSPSGLGRKWSEIVRQWLAAKDNPFLLKTFVNTVLGETWEERGESATATGIMARLEEYDADVPTGAGVLTAGVDVQGDRLEAHVVAWGKDEESWLVAFTQIRGDPETSDEVWRELDRFLATEWETASGRKVGISATAVDAQFASERVYRFCAARAARRIFAVRGGKEKGKPVVGRPTKNNRYRVNLFTLCVDEAKSKIYSRLKIQYPGPGYLHFPSWLDDEYAEQVTSETRLTKHDPRRGIVREWVKTRDRNEALDLTVYSLSALYILGPAFLRALPEKAAELQVPPEKQEAPAVQPRPRRSGWVNGWR